MMIVHRQKQILVRSEFGMFLIMGILVFLGCASTAPTTQPSDSAEATFPVAQEKVREALIDILTTNGYTVREEAHDSRVLTTGYREETSGMWDWLLRSRFGVGRSLVVATLTPEEEGMTRLAIQVTYEEKNRLWHSWYAAQPPVAFSAENNIRLVKNALGLL